MWVTQLVERNSPNASDFDQPIEMIGEVLPIIRL
jgi:hypothetical protein